MNRFKQFTGAAIIALCATLFLVSCNKKETIVESGTAGDITWKITANGTLIISGTGEMPYMVPWWDYLSSITALIIENGVTTITQSAFSGSSSLTEVTIPNSITSIGEYAFAGSSSLIKVTIPNSITSIGRYAFAGCSNLTTINFNAVNCADMGGRGSQVGVQYIYSVFEGCTKVTSVNIGNEVKTIPAFAFYGLSGLTSITIPNSVTSIGEMTFWGCSGLTGTLTIPNSVVYIGNYAFYDCSGLTSVTIPHSVGSIGNIAFSGCSSLMSINVDAANSAYSSDNGVLYNKEKTMLIQYPASKTGAYTIPNSVRIIEEGAFSVCIGLAEVTIGNSVTSIGGWAFSGCSGLTSVTIGNSVASIGNRAFGGCARLTSVTIPSSVVSIEWFAFWHCTGLTEIINQRSTPQVIEETVFENVNKDVITLRVPAASVDAYKAARGWKDFRNIVSME